VPPFRWDLVTPDQLGSLLDGTAEPGLWFLDELVSATGKVLARGGDARLVFVGRSLDSMFDLLSGALPERVARLPLSFSRAAVDGPGGWHRPRLTPAQVAKAREALVACDLDPAALARRPVTFVDVVSEGGTFGELFGLLDDWIAGTRAPWAVIRRQLRFVGVTRRGPTSPGTWRWHQHAGWTARLPARAVVNVSMPYPVWTFLADHQVKLTRTFRPADWLADGLADATGPDRDERTRHALAEAVALVAYGRSRAGRRAIARASAGEPALGERWLRQVVAAVVR
jgi:hypothetical protein